MTLTHKDIYIKFMIEYDKANVTSSYPSLTEYEVATVLDKAYNALIAQKITGNNVRRAGFEMDLKAIEDLAPLIKQEYMRFTYDDTIASNVAYGEMEQDHLYFLECYLGYRVEGATPQAIPQDGIVDRPMLTKLVPHAVANKFLASAFNIPWIKTPISYIEQNKLYVVFDLLNPPLTYTDGSDKYFTGTIVYVKKPNTFVKDLTTPQEGQVTYFEGSSNAYNFECNETVAEELISLAVAFALENVESQRLNSKLNMRGLEA